MANKIPLAYADVELQLSTAIAVGATSFSLSSGNDDDGNALPAGKYCFTIDNGTSNKEYLLGQLNGTDVTSVVSVSRQGVETSGAVRAHRVGASAIVTDFATIQRVADILRGQETLDGSNPVAYDTEPTLTDREEIATVGYVLDNINGGTVDFDNQVITGVNAGETVSAGDLVYFKTSDQEWYKTDADTASTVNGVQLGIALGAGTDGAAITGGVQIAGVYTTSSLTAGSLYYAGNTAGAYTTSAGTIQRVIGVALSTTRLLLIPVTPESVTSDEKDALAGSSGSPSSTNTFITEDDVSASGGSGKVIRANSTSLPNAILGVNKKIAVGPAQSDVVTATTSEIDVISVSIPGNFLSTNNAVRLRVHFSNISIDGTSSACTMTFRCKYGSTTMATLTTGSTSSFLSTLKGWMEFLLIADGSTSAQDGSFIMEATKNQVNPVSTYAANGQEFIYYHTTGTATEDSTGALDLKLTVQTSVSDSDNAVAVSGYTVELIS